jgi:thiol-disulfide isomerase/thioredoxin
MREKRRDVLRAMVAAPSVLLPSREARSQVAKASPAVGSRLPLPDLELIDGGTLKESDASGRLVVIYWWASWCPFCAEMSPHVEKLWQDQRDRGLLVLGISTDKSAEPARAYRKRKGLTFPSTWYEPAMEPLLPKPGLVPVTWVRGRNGRILENVRGQMFPEDVAEIARHL